MKVLITGGAGYLGSVLTERLLNSGYSVTILDNLMYNQTSLIHYSHNKNFDFIYGDVRNHKLLEELVPSFDVVIPLAAIVGFPACDRDKDLATAVNYDHVRKICEIAKDRKIPIFNLKTDVEKFSMYMSQTIMLTS